MLGVGPDDRLHEGMTDNIIAGKVEKFNILNVSQNAGRFDETRRFCAGQVDLGDVSGDDHAAAVSETGEEHHHLLMGGVLGLIEYDEGVREGTSAHVGERGDFDNAALEELAGALLPDHLIHGVVKGGEVGQDFFLKFTGQESEGFTGLDCGTGDNDAFHSAGEQFLECHRHGEVGFSGTCGADAKGDGVLVDGLQVAFLVEGLGDDAALLELDYVGVLVDLAQFAGASLRDRAQGVVEVGAANAEALFAGGVE